MVDRSKPFLDETDDIAAYWDTQYLDWYKDPQWNVLVGKGIWFEERFAHLLPPISEHPTGSVLDYGCGNAMFALPLLNHFKTYYGFDTSQTAIDIAFDYYTNNYPGLLQRMDVRHYSGKTGDWEHPVIVGGKFDLVISITVLQHQPIPYRLAMVENIKQLLKPGGRYIGLEWNDRYTQAFDMPPLDTQAWIDAWKPMNISRDSPPWKPGWFDENVWIGDMP